MIHRQQGTRFSASAFNVSAVWGNGSVNAVHLALALVYAYRKGAPCLRTEQEPRMFDGVFGLRVINGIVDHSPRLPIHFHNLDHDSRYPCSEKSNRTQRYLTLLLLLTELEHAGVGGRRSQGRRKISLLIPRTDWKVMALDISDSYSISG